MQIHMDFLRLADDDFRDSLLEDGWVILADKGNEELDVAHPEVTNERAARARLHRLGLLTSGAIRIEFRPSRPGAIADPAAHRG
jgi:hypothetical protein